MRIISGKLKGKRILAPKHLPVRPTTDMAKESLFNILNNQYYFDAITVMDLFSGTGNIAYEFASRGTQKVYAIDGNMGCVKFIHRTAKALELPIQPYKSDVFKFLEKTTITSDIIFADPPYDLKTSDFLTLVHLTFKRNLLNENGILIIEHSKHTDLSHVPGFDYARKYGGSVFSFFKEDL